MVDQRVGGWAFILGVVIAIIAGLIAGYLDAATQGYIALVLVILGLIIGFLNLNDKEMQPFLIAAIALMLMQLSAGGLNLIPYIGIYLVSMVRNIVVFVMPAALVVGLKAVYRLASKPS
jgi:hypothetical protein